MRNKNFTTLFVLISFFSTQTFAFAALGRTDALVVSSTEQPHGSESEKEGDVPENAPAVPQIYQMHVRSNISNRFTHTTITSKVRNVVNKAQEATFSVILPETAFISGFIMEIDGKNYTAYVKEKEEAKRDYDQAVASGLGAAHVAVSARDSNRFTVSVNVEPETKAAFYLSYEQLLKRQDGHYEQVINLHPGQPVKDLSVEVVITESRKITDLKAPPLRSGNEIGNEKAELDPRADLEIVNDTAAIVRFTPNLERQKQLAHLLGTKEEEGLAGQFVVQYDVERDPQGGEVLVQDGYFVHFFAPSNLDPLPKHVVFVLDTSSSMHGQKIVQLREAMLKILDQLHEKDLFNLVEFNTNVKVWDLNNAESSVWYPTTNDHYNWNDRNIETSFENYTFPQAYSVNADNIKKAKTTASELTPSGGTDIYTGLKVGLHLVELAKAQNKDSINRQPIIVFLTDGDPTIRLTSREEITNKISDFNSGPRKSAIFALSFGYGADKNFLQKLSLRNSGFNKHIYEAADASLQLQDFYREISSPLLADVTFKYEPSVTSLTTTDFPIHFGGSELVVAGWCGTPSVAPPVVDGWGAHGRITLKPTVQQSVSNIERLWAYLTVKQLLEKKEASDKGQEELKKKALDLALKYSFVTPVSSLVVVKPNDTNAVNTETAQGGGRPDYGHRAITAKRRPSSFGRAPPQASQNIAYDARPAAFLPGPPPSFLSGPTASLKPNEYPSTTAQSTVTESISTTPGFPDLLTILPWLKNLLSENGNLNLPSGGGRPDYGHRAYAISAKIGPSSFDRSSYLASSGTASHGFTTFGKTPPQASWNIAYDARPAALLPGPPPSILSGPTGPNEYPSTTAQSTVTESISTTPGSPDLLTILPWLKNILSENGNLNLPSGNYKLGLNETLTDVVSCPKTPLNSAGHCTLLHSCPQVHSLLTNSDVFIQHFCILKNEFAGICCPDNA